jgi:hypothetical protein
MFAYCRKDGLPLLQATLAQKLEHLRDNDIAGPRLPEEISLESLTVCRPIPSDLQSKEPIETCLNWKPEHIRKALEVAAGGAPSGLTQVTYLTQEQQGEYYDGYQTGGNESDEVVDDYDEDKIVEEKDVYPLLAPMMKDLYAYAPKNCTHKQLRTVFVSVGTLLMDIKKASYKEDQSKKQPKRSREDGGTGDDGRSGEDGSRIKLISTNPQLEKATKTHGTKYFRHR